MYRLSEKKDAPLGSSGHQRATTWHEKNNAPQSTLQVAHIDIMKLRCVNYTIQSQYAHLESSRGYSSSARVLCTCAHAPVNIIVPYFMGV